jgi:hypothetical protein
MNIERRLVRIEEQLGSGCADFYEISESIGLTFADLASIAVGSKHAECESCGRQFFSADNMWMELINAASEVAPLSRITAGQCE